MESDIILEGFHNADKLGIRYMNIIGDGDSSVFARIREDGPIWGKQVQKLECSNHVCKCIRSHLEALVDENPSYKGKGNLCKSTRIRLTSSIRCAIRMRSSLPDKKKAAKLLEHDIRNSIFHIYGQHDKCSLDFCKARSLSSNRSVNSLNEENTTDDVFELQSKLWSEGSSIEAQEESRLDTAVTMDPLRSDILKDVALILDRVACKSARLIGNNTTNLAECWMHIRTKFDGGKNTNLCNRGSWHTRCYAGALRYNLGPTWSPQVWEKCTKTRAGDNFTALYEKRHRCLQSSVKSKLKPEARARRWKRKLAMSKTSSSKKARLEYGKEATDVTEDISPSDLKKVGQEFMDSHFNQSTGDIEKIEIESRNQSSSAVWKSERKIRLTSSNFASVFKRNPSLKVAPIVRTLLYSSFKGTAAMRKGIALERVTRQEYTNIAAKEGKNVRVVESGLVIDPQHQFLACSPDGKVVENHHITGLIEIKNLLHGKPINLTQAAKLKCMKNFCLEQQNGKLSLKRTHDYYYQCQGLLNVTQLPWIDFIVRTEKPYEIHVERIYKDSDLWNFRMLPKLSSFYKKAMLPEIAVPRNGKSPGIREPGLWFEDIGVGRRNEDKTAQPKPASHRPNRKKRPSFVGRTISHQWITEGNNPEWYNGTVLSLVRGVAGTRSAVYEIEYEDGIYEIDHLVEDFEMAHVKFIDV
ncbi:uncharacterized protein [Argopecten irradians]|uniref:uncharacterized protein n=1 Tax=Argopecten irradians TaxID=31199 RepID=UPI003713D04C